MLWEAWLVIVIVSLIIYGYAGRDKSSEPSKQALVTREQELIQFLEVEATSAVKGETEALGFNYVLEKQERPVECSKDKDNVHTMCKKSYWTLYGMPGSPEIDTGKIYDTMTGNAWQLSRRDSGSYSDRASAISYISSISSQWGKMEGERLVFQKDRLNAYVSFASEDMARLMVEPGIYVTCIDDPTCKLIKKHSNKYSSFYIVEIYMEASDLMEKL